MAFEFNPHQIIARSRWTEAEKRQMLYALLKDTKPKEKLTDDDLFTLLGQWDDEGAYDMEHDGEVVGIATGYAGVDNLMLGMDAGELIVVGARTSHGKTQFSANVAYNLATQGEPVLFITLEVIQRKLNALFQKLHNGRLYDLPIAVQTERDYNDMSRIEKIVAKAKEEMDVKLVVIDHLHYLVDRGSSSAIGLIGEATRTLKLLAVKYQIPILLPAQVNREGAQSIELLSKHHLFGAGFIEQDADIVIMLHRGSADDKVGIAADELVVKVDKNRPRARVGTTMLKVSQNYVTLREPLPSAFASMR